MTRPGSIGNGGVLPLPLAGEGWGGGFATGDAPQEERAPTRVASRRDLPRKRERLHRVSG